AAAARVAHLAARLAFVPLDDDAELVDCDRLLKRPHRAQGLAGAVLAVTGQAGKLPERVDDQEPGPSLETLQHRGSRYLGPFQAHRVLPEQDDEIIAVEQVGAAERFAEGRRRLLGE